MAREKAEGSLAAAEARVGEAAAKAETSLRSDVAALARQIATRILGREVA